MSEPTWPGGPPHPQEWTPPAVPAGAVPWPPPPVLPPAPPAAQPWPPVQSGWPQPYAARSSRTGMPGWAIALIAGGTSVVVLLVLAAVAIPTFLDQRARAQTPHIPDRVGHLTRSHDPSVTAELDSVTPTMSDGFADVETGVFLTSDGTPFLLVVTGRDRTGDGEDDFERATREFMAGLANYLPPGNDVGPAVDVAAGPVGGRVACAEVFSAGQPLGHSCLSARGAAIVITFSLGPTDEALVTMVRRAVLPEQ